MIKTYYLMRLTQLSPLRISSGEGEHADSDLIMDARGFPYIPGSSLAGVLRAMLPKNVGDRLFGTLTDSPCSIVVSDAVLRCGETDFSVTVRDGVGLDDAGTAEENKKYDFEVLECAAPYHAVLEVNDHMPEMQLLMQEIAAEDGLRVGGRTTRGYGRMRVEIRQRKFSFPEDLVEWLEWDSFAAASWNECDPVILQASPSDRQTVVQAEISIRGSFTVRSFVGEDQLNNTYLTDRDGHPVIPGTAWAGVFRHHMRVLARELGFGADRLEQIDLLFGMRDGQEGFLRSAILFSETVIAGGKPYRWTRVGVDRVTAAPSNGKLFTNEYCEGGTGILTIHLPKDGLAPWQRQLTACCLMDLDSGILHFGGEGSVGRGTVEITRLTVDGTDRTEALKTHMLTQPGEVMV